MSNHLSSENEQARQQQALELTGTKAQIVDAALEALKEKGYAGASAREIARRGDFNQALIFYHFGSVRNLLLTVVDVVSARRMQAYRPIFEQMTSLTDLAELARRIYTDDLEHGYITVLGEMVAAGVSDQELGREVVARMGPWRSLVETKASALLEGSAFESLIDPRDIAFGFIALYLGIDMLTHLDRDQSRAESMLALGAQLSNVVAGFLPSQQRKESR